ncbi:MAG: hypothetical protein H6713_20595 [Myxococcales bacterium]|nr:hypothetical protein [Myxococcales bacterium]
MLQRAQAIDTRPYESDTIEAARGELVPDAEALLTNARELLARVFNHYERDDASTLAQMNPNQSFSWRVDDLMRADRSSKQIADLASIARMELAHRGARLRGLPNNAGVWEVIAAVAGARRRTLKSASAIQRAIGEHEGIKIEDEWYETELDRSLRVRQTYAKFRGRLQLDQPPDMRGLYTRLRLVGTSLAMLVGLDEYEFLRIPDRQMIRGLQHKILGWLRVDASVSGRFPARAGTRIWEDVCASANLLLQVNNRAELVEHDALALRAADELLRAGDVEVARARQVMQPLFGLDPELDQALTSQVPPTVSTLRELVARLRQRSGSLGRDGPRAPSW